MTHLPQNDVTLIKSIQANVLISESGNAQVCDYGLTAFTSGTSFAIAATPGPVGSSRWAAPEILNPPNSSNPSIASKPADVFAFAMLAVEVYTGELPYGDVENIWPLLLKVIDGKRPDKPKTNEITKNIWKSIEKCWSQDPKRRPGIDQVVSTWKRLVNWYVVLSFGSSASQRPHSVTPTTLWYPQPATGQMVSHLGHVSPAIMC